MTGIVPRRLIRHLEWLPSSEESREMGEVKVKVTLVNSSDESSARRGQVAAEAVRKCEVEAVVDTGAVSLVIPPHVMGILGLLSRGTRVAEYADGRKEPVDVTEPMLVRIEGRETAEEALVLGDEVLVGQTVLEKLDFFVDCLGRRLVPNPAHPEQPVAKIR